MKPLQATVWRFDPASRTGAVLTDDGVGHAFDAVAFDASGLRLLRPGQRVRLDWDGEVVVRVTIATLP